MLHDRLFVYDPSPEANEGRRFEYFQAEKYKKSASARSVTCPICKKRSFNPNDVEARYCGNCHVFWGDAEDAGELGQLKWIVQSGHQ